MAFHNLMNRSVTVQKVAQTSDEFGSWVETWSTRFADMPCRIQPLSGRERALYGRERTEVSHRMYCPGEYADISERDRVVDGTKAYEVVFVGNPDLSSHHLEIDLRELRGDVT